MVGSISYATSILLGQAMGRGSVQESRTVVTVGMSVALALALALGSVVAAIPRQLGHIFSSDPSVLDKFEEIRIPLGVSSVVVRCCVLICLSKPLNT